MFMAWLRGGPWPRLFASIALSQFPLQASGLGLRQNTTVNKLGSNNLYGDVEDEGLVRRSANEYTSREAPSCKQALFSTHEGIAASSEDTVPCEYFVRGSSFLLRDQKEGNAFVLNNLERYLEDAVYDFGDDRFDFEACSLAQSQDKRCLGKEQQAVAARVELAKNMFALRHAWLALSCLNGDEAEQQRSMLQKVFDRVPENYVTSTSDAPQIVENRRTLATQIRSALTSPAVQQLFQVAVTCSMRHIRDVQHLEQVSRIRPKGTLTKDSYMLLSKPDGSISENGTKMPLMTLGTGYTDCYMGQYVHYSTQGQKGVLGGPCDGFPKSGFYKHAVNLGYKAVDTAYIYGTEEQIGTELSGRPDVFISTKTISPQFRQFMHVTHGTDQIAKQLQWLHKNSVDVLYNHHDDENSVEWVALEKEVDEGRAKALGASSLDDAALHEECVRSGRCRHHVSIIQEDVSPCLPQNTIKRFMQRLNASNSTLLGHSAVGSCINEPIITNLAKELKKTVAQVANRWVLHQGVPVVVQTSNPHHASDNLHVFDFALTEGQLDLIAIIPRLYDFDRRFFDSWHSQ